MNSQTGTSMMARARTGILLAAMLGVSAGLAFVGIVFAASFTWWLTYYF